MFGCGTPLQTSVGMDGLLDSNFEESRRLLKELGYAYSEVKLDHSDRSRVLLRPSH